MSYETAPSTILLATHCAACARPLRDADSVEAGMGPDCREKYGYACAQGEPDWAKVDLLLIELANDHAPALQAHYGNAHKMANVAVNLAARMQRSERGTIVELIAALGFEKLSRKLADAAGEVVEIKRAGDVFDVVTPYRATFVGDLKAARIGARWNPERKVWNVPTDDRARKALWNVIRANFVGTFLSSDKGLARICA